PGRALHEIVGRLRPVVRADHAVAPARARAVRSDAPAHRLPVLGDRLTIRHLGRRALLEPVLGQVPLLARIDEGRAHPEDVKTELADGAVAARRLHAELLARDLADGALGGDEHSVEPSRQLGRRELLALLVAGPAQL